MDDRFNTISGWVLFSGVVALGLTSLSGHYFLADKERRPEKMGYEIEGVVSSEEGEGGDAVPIETLLASADAAKGEAVYKKCASCHTINQGGPNGIGPNLHAIMGDSIGHGRGGFAFSDALKNHGGNWDWTSMNEWLTNPKKFAPGTKMTFAGLAKPEDRANLMAYLNSQGSNLPLPAAPAAAAAPAGDASAAATAVSEANATPGAPAGPGAAGAAAAPQPSAASPAEQRNTKPQ